VTETKELIRVDGISFQYGPLPVLDEVRFSVLPGDFLAIIGPNGSGKTTLVKIILGVLRPTRGRIFLMGRPIEEFKGWSRIGYVPQKASHIDPFFPATVREVVAMGLLTSRPPAGHRKKREGGKGGFSRPRARGYGGLQKPADR